jgi:hypothetical protein
MQNGNLQFAPVINFLNILQRDEFHIDYS